MTVRCRTTATVRRGDEWASVTLALHETSAEARYWRTMCRADEVNLKGPGGGEPGEPFKTCESAIYGAVFYALRRVEGHFAFLVLDVNGEIGEGGADGFALAAAHAVWRGAGYTPREEDLPILEGWQYEGEGAVTEAQPGDLKRPGIPAAPGIETLEDLERDPD